jgi:hypothetical protein
MIDDRDVWAAAVAIVKRYGDDAEMWHWIDPERD